MFCTNCGKKMHDNDIYCTECGFKSNYINNSSFNNDDVRNILMYVGAVAFPVFWIIFYFAYRKSFEKSRNYLITAFISLVLKVIIFLAIVWLNMYVFNNFKDSVDNFIDNLDIYDYYFDDRDEDNDYKEFYDLTMFQKNLEQYVELAKEKFSFSSNSNECYDIDNLLYSSNYDGSIEISNIDSKLVIIIWLTDGNYYVNGVNYDEYDINDIEDGNFIEKSCKFNTSNNSL